MPVAIRSSSESLLLHDATASDPASCRQCPGYSGKVCILMLVGTALSALFSLVPLVRGMTGKRVVAQQLLGHHASGERSQLLHRAPKDWRLQQVFLDNTTIGKGSSAADCCVCRACNSCTSSSRSWTHGLHIPIATRRLTEQTGSAESADCCDLCDSLANTHINFHRTAPMPRRAESEMDSTDLPEVEWRKDVPLYGGAMMCSMPSSFKDVSEMREVPDHQEVWVDSASDRSIIIEINERQDLPDYKALVFFWQDLVSANEADEHTLAERRALGRGEVPNLPAEVKCFTCTGEQHIAKHQEATYNHVRIYLALMRLKDQHTDILVMFNDPVIVDSTATMGKPVFEDGTEVFAEFLKSFMIDDWNVFGVSAADSTADSSLGRGDTVLTSVTLNITPLRG
eukprot:gnl/TRDRNA2_/TRDRNA2_205096_c0_seq1.p1 gnl/TRDRNA2_/TRDRNA2_205096_c0~~gnl/TRDRNA2_/TRDRNA2_205096_c0_seq1.p1  ORF type:complete len:398 (+),score=57.81 gnl/TRDRNA2_/TRDRNA2_205096_c0_seq1:70-1263(+)